MPPWMRHRFYNIINIFRNESKQKYIVESAFLMGEKMEEDLKTN